MSYYTVLNIPTTASQSEIKSAYRKLALVYHPDKQGDPIKFKELSNAYSVLSDPEKKAKYDCFGDIPPDFDEQNNTYVIKINLTLEQIYLGYLHKQKVMTKIICPDCIMFMETCPECSGTGKITQMFRTGPFMQQMSSICKSCFSGQRKKEETSCKKCLGSCILTGSKIVDIKFQPGNLDLNKNIQIGDYTYIFNGILEKHDLFNIIGNDLHLSLDIKLGESLTESYTSITKFLDGKDLIIAPDFIIVPGDKYCIKGKGMSKNADLIITFNVIFPDKFTEKRKEYLRKIFNISPDYNKGTSISNTTLIKCENVQRQDISRLHGMPGIQGMPGLQGMPGMNVQMQSCAHQ